MKCQDCDQPASVHTTIRVEGREAPLHLCRDCARKRQVIIEEDPPQLTTVMKQFFQGGAWQSVDLSTLACPHCKLTFAEFRKQGRLGCPYDYVAFREGLVSLLDRVHRSVRHVGKRPRHQPAPVERDDERRQLRRELRAAVDNEDYERAARLRDQLRGKGLGNGS